jgi:FKBP-type peptidyl-prolyl cis-trans isomerase
MTTRVYALCLSSALLTACIDSIDAPACAPVSFSQAAVSGDTITTTTGLRYIEGTQGAGVAVDWCRSLAIHYDAFLLDGTKFDSSREEDPVVFTPGFGGLIDGIEQGVVGMRARGTRRLIISPVLGFGSEPRRDASGQIVIPGNSTVVYDIEVVEVAQ